jgi:hypothetical protein
MKRKIYSNISLWTLILGAATGGYALAKTWIIRASLPAGTCPITTNRPLLYIGIALCLVSFVFTLFDKGDKKSRSSDIGTIESESGSNDA